MREGGDTREAMASTLSRAQSWPLLVQAAIGGGGAGDGARTSAQEPPTFTSPKELLEPRRLLRRHYYPEGGWAWIILVSSTLVQILNHGLQLSAGVVLVPMAQGYDVSITDAGNYTDNGCVWSMRKICLVNL